ncbi:MAG: HAD family hydrolase [Crocinitomicaceae bacterium]|nr:HAD family hydrolase [Crocinitomicaceae bacterium]
MKHKALFLDRDGVINHDPGDYTFSLEEFVLLPTVIPSLQLAQQKGYRIIVITNQGGIAKGLYTEETVRSIHDYFIRVCKEAGVEIAAIYFSPHHPDFGNSLSRKPCSLMIERAIQRFDIDVERSVMVGDRNRDMECAARAGVRGFLLPVNGDLLSFVQTLD